MNPNLALVSRCVMAASLAVPAIAQTIYPNAAPRATSSVVPLSNIGAPSLRYWGGSTTDGARMFVFGGRSVDSTGTAGSTYFNGLYAYDPVANSWATLGAEGATLAPSNRWRTAVAYDPLGNRVVVFGGRDAGGAVLSDCRSFDLATNTWSILPNIQPGVTGPTARFDGDMEYDATSGALVLFGGQGAGGNTDRFGDTWLLVGSAFIQASPANSPSARSIFAMTDRSAPYNDIVLVGGRNVANTRLTETWRWDGSLSDWVQITPAGGTAPVTFGGGNDAVYDSVRQVVTIINGTGTGVAPSTVTSAGSWTSEYDCVTNEWRAYGSNTTSQGADDPLIGRHQRFAVAFLNGKTYAWGGQNAPSTGDSILSSVREYQASPVAGTLDLGVGCNSLAGPLALAADSAPWTGRTVTLTGTGFSAGSLAALVIGFGTQSVPVASVIPQGVPGCQVEVTVDSIVFLPTVAGQMTYSVPVPFNPALAGITVNVQGFCIEFNAGGVLNRVSSTNGVAGTIGAL